MVSLLWSLRRCWFTKRCWPRPPHRPVDMQRSKPARLHSKDWSGLQCQISASSIDVTVLKQTQLRLRLRPWRDPQFRPDASVHSAVLSQSRVPSPQLEYHSRHYTVVLSAYCNSIMVLPQNSSCKGAGPSRVRINLHVRVGLGPKSVYRGHVKH